MILMNDKAIYKIKEQCNEKWVINLGIDIGIV